MQELKKHFPIYFTMTLFTVHLLNYLVYGNQPSNFSLLLFMLVLSCIDREKKEVDVTINFKDKLGDNIKVELEKDKE